MFLYDLTWVTQTNTRGESIKLGVYFPVCLWFWYPSFNKIRNKLLSCLFNLQETTEPVPTAPVMVFPQAYTVSPQVYYPPMPYAVPQQVAPRPAPIQIQPKDVQNIKDMFPDMDEEVIRSVLASSGGNVDAALNHLLSMNEKWVISGTWEI